MTEIAGKNVLERFRRDLRHLGIDLEQFESRMDELLRGAGSPGVGPKVPWPPVEVEETATGYRVRIELPGVSKGQTHVRFLDQVLEVRVATASSRGERHRAPAREERAIERLVRRVTFPTPVAVGGATAGFDNGTLTVTVPRQTPATEHVVRVE